MPTLKCDVASCIHNAERCCCKGEILVEGSNAKESDDTFCASFVEREDDSFSNMYETPDYYSDVECEATDCMYNIECECHAEQIGICGGRNCNCSEDTACATFKCR